MEERPDKKLLTTRTIKQNGNLELSDKKGKQLVIDKDLKKLLIGEFENWMKSNNQPPNDYKVLDARFRLAGNGSMGIKRYVFLIQKKSDLCKYMLIDMKQATPSSLQSYIKIAQPKWESEAHRMVYIQRMMQNIPPAQLSTLCFEDNYYLMQELQPTKDRINFQLIDHNVKTVWSVIEDMPMLTASAHLRSVSRKGSCSADELIAFGNNNNWQNEIINYAWRYKRKVISDWLEFKNDSRLKDRKDVAGTGQKVACNFSCCKN